MGKWGWKSQYAETEILHKVKTEGKAETRSEVGAKLYLVMGHSFQKSGYKKGEEMKNQKVQLIWAFKIEELCVQVFSQKKRTNGASGWKRF